MGEEPAARVVERGGPDHLAVAGQEPRRRGLLQHPDVGVEDHLAQHVHDHRAGHAHLHRPRLGPPRQVGDDLAVVVAQDVDAARLDPVEELALAPARRGAHVLLVAEVVGVLGEERHRAPDAQLLLLGRRLRRRPAALVLRRREVVQVAGEDRAPALAEQSLDHHGDGEPGAIGVQSRPRTRDPAPDDQDVGVEGNGAGHAGRSGAASGSSASARISAGWRAVRPVPVLICWRQLVPAAAISADTGAARTAGSSATSAASRERS